MDGERLWELGTLDLLLGGPRCLRGLLESAVLLRVTVLHVLQQVGLLHVEERTLGAGKDLGGHLHGGSYGYTENTSCCFMLYSNIAECLHAAWLGSDARLRLWFLGYICKHKSALVIFIKTSIHTKKKNLNNSRPGLKQITGMNSASGYLVFRDSREICGAAGGTSGRPGWRVLASIPSAQRGQRSARTPSVYGQKVMCQHERGATCSK